MGFAVWINETDGIAWAQGTHEYRPMGTATVAIVDRFRARDFRSLAIRPTSLNGLFCGFFGSLEAVNHYLSHEFTSEKKRRYRPTLAHLL